MAQPPPVVLSVVKLIDQARFHPAGALPAGTHQSYPVPVTGRRGLRVAFFYCTAMIVKPGEGLQLMTPSYVAFVNAESGEFDELKAVKPAEFGQKHTEGKFIGRSLTPPERLLPEFLTMQVRLYQAFDLLLPVFAKGQAGVAPGVKKAAAEFKALFPR